MKAATLLRPAFGLLVVLFIVCILVSFPKPAASEDDDYQESTEKYSSEQLAQMLAPIALYPDSLLSQVLMAATYPIEVVEADRWVRRHSGLKGDALDEALLDLDWDPSVKAVCHFPSILELMSERISETTELGNAFLAQESDVMDMVQELRARARAQDHLVSDSRQKVIVENEKIIIEPVDPRIVYVSYYDPLYVYGPWWYPGYPPYYWGPPGVRIGFGIAYWPAFYFSVAFGGWSYFDWHRHYIHIERDRRPGFVRQEYWRKHHGRWFHIPEHRRGVVYRDRSTAWKYGQIHPRHRDFHRDPNVYPDNRKPGLFPENRKPEVFPENRKPGLFPESGKPDPDRRGGMRPPGLPENRTVVPGRPDQDPPDRSEVERKDRNLPKPGQVDRSHQDEHAERVRQIQEQAARNRLERDKAATEGRMPPRSAPDIIPVQPIIQEKQGRDRVEQSRRERQSEQTDSDQQQSSPMNSPSPMGESGRRSSGGGNRPGPGDPFGGKGHSGEHGRSSPDERSPGHR